MDEILKQIMQKLEGLEQGQNSLNERMGGLEQGQKSLSENVEGLQQGQTELKQGQENIKDEIKSFKTQVNTRFDKLEKKIDVVQNTVGDLMEFKGEAEGKLKKIK